ncbi:hypothetical protein HFO60_04555 [Rhizobium leguminosarum]|uniref:hypothetical protein n=1 Tax=Rhizobium TaxID=379 RepID=UPI001C91E604|nr:hypothetical protein [Rhizobium leguminosarum]MBY3179911.1 hypothetical protein [Rhizobium leguminosarum]MBY5539321.1 hypothetical protein [Rhizobium leguminosarum]
MADTNDFSEEEIAAVREHADRQHLSGHEERWANLARLGLWDAPRLTFNERGMKIRAMLIGDPNSSEAELAVMFPYLFGENNPEQKAKLEQRLLELGLAWVTERGSVFLNARGDKVMRDVRWLRH